jgi:hypothetical protein
MRPKIHQSSLTLAMAMLLSLGWLCTSEAQLLPITTRVITINNLAVAALRHPTTPGPKAKIGIFIMHPDGSYVNNVACTQLAGRGYTTLCADSIFLRRGQDYYGYEQHAPGIASGINFLKNPANVDGIVIEKFIVWGHSVGAPLMAFYQNVAENGAAKACQGPEKIIPCDASTLNNLPVPDGVILADAHLGAALATFTYVDPAIKKDAKPGIRNPSLDMFDASNGYPGDDAAGSPTFKSATYTDKFKQRFLEAQANRNADLLHEAQNIWSDIQAGKSELYPDDMPFVVPGSDGAARLWQADTSLVNCTKKPHIFLTHTGTQNPSPGPICSVRIPSASAEDDDSFASVLKVTVRVWLGAHALRTNGRYDQTKDDITGIDYDSSATSTASNVKGITKPLLIAANSAHYFIRPDEIVYDAAKSTDKTYAITEGAVHGGTPCTQCAQALGLPPDYFGDTIKRIYDFMDEWLSQPGRFLP